LYKTQNFRDVLVTKEFFSTQKFKSENFMHNEWSEVKFLKGRIEAMILKQVMMIAFYDLKKQFSTLA